MTEHVVTTHTHVNHRLDDKSSNTHRFIKPKKTKQVVRKVGEGSGEVAKEDSPKPTVTWQTFEATAYVALCDTGCTGITASGYDVRDTIYSPNGRRIIAADPSVLPIGTVVELKVGDDWRFEAVVLDTGGLIKGNRLDLLVGTVDRAFDFGRQDVKVRILN